MRRTMLVVSRWSDVGKSMTGASISGVGSTGATSRVTICSTAASLPQVGHRHVPVRTGPLASRSRVSGSTRPARRGLVAKRRRVRRPTVLVDDVRFVQPQSGQTRMACSMSGSRSHRNGWTSSIACLAAVPDAAEPAGHLLVERRPHGVNGEHERPFDLQATRAHRLRGRAASKTAWSSATRRLRTASPITSAERIGRLLAKRRAPPCVGSRGR